MVLIARAERGWGVCLAALATFSRYCTLRTISNVTLEKEKKKKEKKKRKKLVPWGGAHFMGFSE